MTQITGHAEFSELFLDDVVVPRENLLGQLGDGWKIAMHTLGHERGTAALPRQVKLRTWLDRAVSLATPGASSTVSPVLDDPEAQTALARALIGIEVLRHHAYRTVGEFLNGGAVGPESSSVKLLMAEAEQRLAATVLEVLGPTLLDSDSGRPARKRVLVRDVSVFARRECLWRHSADPAGHHRRPNPVASEGLAVDLDLSDEQVLARGVHQHAARSPVAARAERLAGGRGRTGTLWESLVEFGLVAGVLDGHLGAIELCLAARAARRSSRIGRHCSAPLASVTPWRRSRPSSRTASQRCWPATPAFRLGC